MKSHLKISQFIIYVQGNSKGKFKAKKPPKKNSKVYIFKIFGSKKITYYQLHITYISVFKSQF